jgi:hypothetical protein
LTNHAIPNHFRVSIENIREFLKKNRDSAEPRIGRKFGKCIERIGKVGHRFRELTSGIRVFRECFDGLFQVFSETDGFGELALTVFEMERRELCGFALVSQRHSVIGVGFEKAKLGQKVERVGIGDWSKGRELGSES